jgi:flagellar biosynthesis protein FlhA
MVVRSQLKTENSIGRMLLGNTDIIAAVAFVAMVAMMIIPIPKGLLDVLLTLNIAFSLVVLLTTLFTTDTRELNIFPSVLLTATLFRLALNVSSTRLILSEGEAGKVIAAFGDFVVGGNYVVGMVIFIIITVVQFVVITNGSGRIAEVAARFTLDALPGKQMSIDADFNAGLIDEETARRKRRELQKEADFYGAMDGASKFVRGDAIAGIVIVLVNIIGGLAIGMLQRGMDAAGAAQVYTLLTVGDGLVAQIPALLISISAGMLVTRSTAEASFGEELTGQLLAFPRVIMVTAVLLFALGIVPGIPPAPFFLLAAALGALSFYLTREQKSKAAREQELSAAPVTGSITEPEDFRSLIRVELLEIEIGYNLVILTDETRGGNLLERITAARRRAVNELGIIIQPIRVRDNLHLGPYDYLFKLKGNAVAQGQVRPGLYLALNPEGELPAALEGIATREPTFNLPALWVAEEFKEKAEMLGCTVVDAATVLITHLTEVIKSNAHELLGRQSVKEMLEMIKETHPAVVEELTPEVMTLGEIQKVMQNLLKEKVPLHDQVTIFEALADQGRVTRDLDQLTEAVRQGLKRTITHQLAGASGMIHAITLDPALEKAVAEALQATRQGTIPVMDPAQTHRLVETLGRMLETLDQKGISPVVLTTPAIRLPVRRLLERFFPQVAVVSINEILPEVKVEAVGVIKADED